jgi:tetratricopeptide (TPR) repeat protein
MFAVSGNAYSSARDSFEKGISFFKSKKYPAAIKYFKKAEKNGLKTASLYFNLGSSYYKNKQYKKSEIYFKKLSTFPKMRSIASFNIGLVSKKMGKIKTAQKWFKWVIKKSTNKKLVALSRQQLKNTKKKSPKIKNRSPWSHYASLTFGHDNNIDTAPSGTALEQSDNFMTIFLNTRKLLKGTRSNGWFAGASFFHIDYDKLNTNNETQYGASLKRSLNISDWKSKLTLKLTKNTYAGADYQTNLIIEAAGSKKLSRTNTLKLRYRFNDINSDNIIYDYLEGRKHQVRAELKQQSRTSKQRFYYEYETNDRQDTATLSYSPTRHTLRAIHTIKISQTIHWGGELSYRQSDYPVVASVSRDSTRWKYGVFGIYRFDKTMKLKARLIHTDNNSDSATYDYDKDIISLSLSKLF